MGYRIGTFNVRNLSGKDCSKKLDVIARIIRDNNLDIVALQEVLDQGQILYGGMGKKTTGQAAAYEDYLLRRLPKYQMRWGASNVKKKKTVENGDKRGEGYAFIWNTKRIELAKQVTPSGTIDFNPRIWGQYSIRRADGRRRLVRDPFYGRFKIKGKKQEIRLITTHIYFGSNYADDIDLRKKELNILAGAIYPRLHDKRYGVNTPSITILLGDYNLNLPDSATVTAKLDTAVIVVDENGEVRNILETVFDKNVRTFTTKQSELSTLKSSGSEEAYSNNYDHITYETRHSGNLRVHDGDSISAPRVKKVSEIKGIKFEEYRKVVSDHIPVIFDLSL